MLIQVRCTEEVAEIATMDDTPFPTPAGGNIATSEATLEAFSQIGKVLATCEASSIRVGVPFLYPTPRVSALKQSFEGTVRDYLRYNLVNVNTSTLELFLEDLENLADSRKISETLAIPAPTRWERYSLTMLLAVVAGVAIFASIESVLGSSFWAISSAMTVTALTIIGFIMTSSDTYRRTTFCWILLDEIKRRKGLDSNTTSNLQICPTVNS